jgi:hypothetical protein
MGGVVADSACKTMSNIDGGECRSRPSARTSCKQYSHEQARKRCAPNVGTRPGAASVDRRKQMPSVSAQRRALRMNGAEQSRTTARTVQVLKITRAPSPARDPPELDFSHVPEWVQASHHCLNSARTGGGGPCRHSSIFIKFRTRRSEQRVSGTGGRQAPQLVDRTTRATRARCLDIQGYERFLSSQGSSGQIWCGRRTRRRRREGRAVHCMRTKRQG